MNLKYTQTNLRSQIQVKFNTETMEKVEMLNNIQKMVVDIHIKMYDLRNRIAYETDEDVKARAKALLNELDEIQTSLHEQFNALDRTQGDKRISGELEKNIYESISSFDDAFKNAGGIFRSANRETHSHL